MKHHRLAGWCGLVFSALSLIVLPLVGFAAPPPLGANAESFAQYYRDHHATFLLGNFLGVAAFTPGLVQLAVLAARIRAREDAGGWLASFVLASGVFTYAIFFASLIAYQALPFLTDPHDAPGTLAVGNFGAIFFALDGLAALPLVIAVIWAALATGALPRWFAHLSWGVVALALLMSAGAMTDAPAWLAAGGTATLVGFVAFFVWTGVLGAVFLRLPD